MDLDEAKIALEEEKQARESACMAEIKEILTKHNCVLDVTMMQKPGQYPQAVVRASSL